VSGGNGAAAIGDADIRSALDGTREQLIDVRRQLHRDPELSLQEHRTAAVIAARAEQFGYAVRTGVGGTGVVADLAGAGEGPTIMIRADMDALPIVERGDGRVAVSGNPGVMHACGHDGHVSMALATADVLAGLRDRWNGRIRMCFEPAEEIASGALPMIDDGVLDGVDAVLGIHLWAPLQVGTIGVRPGALFGSADEFALTVRGRGGHGGMPHTSVDAIVVCSMIILALQTLVSRETSPFAPAVVTVGRIEGGTAFNVIPEEVMLRGTVRAMDHADRERLLARVPEVAASIAEGMRCTVAFERLNGCPPVVSDTGMAALVREAAVASVGEDAVEEVAPVTVGDDVACFLERVPGCYFLVGAGDVAKHAVAPHHHPEFDIDERCLPIGVEVMTRAALAALAGGGGHGATA